jgi:hypothetical protein
VVERGRKDEGILLATDVPGPDAEDHVFAFDAEGTRLAVGWHKADHVLVFNPRSGREVARLADLPAVTGLQFLSSNVLLVTQRDCCLRCGIRQGDRKQLTEEGHWIAGIAVSPDGRVVALGENEFLVLYDAARWRVRQRLARFAWSGSPHYIVFSSGGSYVASSVCMDKQDFIVVWDAQNGRRQRTFEVGQGARPLAFRKDTLTLAVDGGGVNGRLLLYKADEGEEPPRTYELEDYANAVQFRDRGRMLAVLLDGGGMVFLETETGQVQRRIPPPARSPLRRTRPSRDWSLCAAIAEGGVFAWSSGRTEPAAAPGIKGDTQD